ncbi:nuclear transport factor 2 family protein [Devosia beringensis]|uniref:nuclear transport factor 2 family protein n=1 Tax=Devosia beringensis TaxID=2657486 RepID=UPI00186BA218|nr:nuclear transport factor 2 family protein [Devosia beringensis]
MSLDLAQRLQRLEDRHTISERVITYATSIDAGDWAGFGACFTDSVHVDFSAAGMPAQDFDRTDFVAFASAGLSGFKARQHLSPNHVITFDPVDPDRATCTSYMYAQHYQPGAASGPVFVMHGSYINALRRTTAGWQIEALTQLVSWMDGAPEPMTAAAH